ncbi:P-loop containing nucleoside triphosphate hydrolase protein [Rhexocercosporidium sp. MPI-PUGE-AT-0058]|nr:P-loop containing nucleoside triphosphate hydrolase protein [Rhexocercosporidium sp. MPI-PUGE-AT-0058]
MVADAFRDYPGHLGLNQRPSFSDISPFVHNWQALEKVSAESDTSEDPCRDHLSNLLNLLKRSKILQSYFRDFKQKTEVQDKALQFKDLPYLFYPGQLVFATPHKVPQAFLVHDWAFREFGLQPRSRNRWGGHRRQFEVFCWTYNFDGREFTRASYNFIIPQYNELKRVSTLRVYPIDYHHKAKDITDDLLNRGKRFRELCIAARGHQMFDYKGDVSFISNRPEDMFGDDFSDKSFLSTAMMMAALDRETGDEDSLARAERVESNSKTFHFEGHVMVDAQGYNMFGPDLHFFPGADAWSECDCSQCEDNIALKARIKVDYDHVTRSADGQWTDFEDEQLIICPPRVKGYALASKMWVHMDVCNVKNIRKLKSEDAFNNKLIIPGAGGDKTKKLIRSLVEHHTAQAENIQGVPGKLQDFVEGKGQGLVILLYGVPGVGKTLTAEAISELTGRPLLKVNVADIGLVIEKVEKRLNDLFQMASDWGAVLLFDEADVLLETRNDQAALARNCLVSVFLKVLEYYEGILILTTNRMKSMDSGVQSRIHLAVQFPNFTKAEQKRVWKLFLSQLDEHALEKRKINNWLDDYYQDNNFNGRQIRNNLSAAMSLARGEGRPLGEKDIRVFMQQTNEFEKFLAKKRLLADETQT